MTLPPVTRHAAPIPASLRERIRAFENLDQGGDPGYLEAVGTISALCAEIAHAERHGMAPTDIRSALDRVRSIHGRSQFIRRLQEWPRGYPGDFESIDMLLDAPATTAPGTLERHCERHAYDCPAAQQHRNKIRWQAKAMLEVARALGPTGRILVVACGGVRDAMLVARQLDALGCPELVINDSDPDAVATSVRRLAGVAQRITVAPGNVLELVRRRGLGRFDLVLMGGLADYLADRQLRFLIQGIRTRLLRPGGRLLFTNIAEGNPYRTWMSYIGDWHLIERTPEGLGELAGGPVKVDRDRTGLSLLAEVPA